jgi:ElaB/YqjD/DUF883 family membrane-anchored ribosome-binding protein
MAKTPSADEPELSAHELADQLDEIVEDAVRKLKQDIERTVADASDSASQASAVLARAARVLAAEARDRSRTYADQASEQARRLAEEARLRSRAVYDRAHEEILDHPVTAMAAAAGLGLLIGALLGRRN